MLDLTTQSMLVVGADDHRVEPMVQVLERAGVRLHATKAPREALRLLARQTYDILLIDGRFGEPFPDAFPRVGLCASGEAPRNILLIDPPRGPALTHWLRVLEGHDIRPRVLELESPWGIIEALLTTMAAAPSASVSAPGSAPEPHTGLHPPGSPPDLQGLHFVLSLWARRRTGRLEMPLLGRRAEFVLGEPVSDADLAAVVQALYVGGATFAADTGGRDQVVDERLGRHLWEAGLRLADADYVMARLSHLLVERGAGRRAKDLPLPDALHQLLDRRRERTSVLGLCGGARVAPSSVAGPLSVLVQMGLFSLRPAPDVVPDEEPPSLLPAFEELTPVPPVASLGPAPAAPAATQTTRFYERPAPAPPSVPAAPPPPPPPTPAPGATRPQAAAPRPASSPPAAHGASAPRGASQGGPSRSSATHSSATHSSATHGSSSSGRGERAAASPEAQAALLKRLQREWELIELADDWTVLGIPEGSPQSLIQRATDRLERRYGGLSDDDSAPAEIRDIAQRILERLRGASSAIRTGQQRPAGADKPEAAFREGVLAMERGNFSQASRWLQAARQADPRSAVYNGYLGWAIYNDPSLPAVQRRKKGMELLQLAEVTAEPLPELQYFLALVEKGEGDLERARARLQRLVRTTPQYTAAKRALDKLPAAESEG